MQGSMTEQDLNRSLGSAISNRAITATLYVSPNGNNTNGSTWATAYNTLNSALDAASIDAHDLTLIVLAPHDTYYDINTTGDPTWAANVEIMNSHRRWTVIKNTHASATSMLKLTGKASVRDLAFSQQGAVSGLIMTNSGFRVRNCGFNSSTCTGAVNGLYLDGTAALMQGGKVEGCQFLGNATYTTAVRCLNIGALETHHLNIHGALVGLSIDGASTAVNFFEDVDFGLCATGINIIDGTGSHFENIHFHGCTVNVVEGVTTNNIWKDISGELATTAEPDDFTGVAVDTGDGADTWSSNVEVRPVASGTKPFRILGFNLEAGTSEKYRIRFSADGGSTYFTDFQFEGVASGSKVANVSQPSGTEFIFSQDTQIVASSKSESAGVDSLDVWLEIQEI